ncbi:hypothetical protein D554_0683 [Bordetella holmesii 30539]|uniref:Uncharacterized protein n=2 Tax=Bordetella holmesii TaxID=35814 RepID=A0A158M827_9BORD|nr:hypothetical protein D560_1207 [Bordetella holmesii ATCC 51541]AIT25873.1 hypothetical protein D558_1195 [Bordetella holmesii 44057]EWM42069.1 hypothetical protein D556_1203 [Bordetella holmesii 41130]EWM46441.1 hypothetical protein D555_1216 [Bordetella holmesii 35009]EWM50606.1 hypothetical protein D557_0451 [Bordetella holmesii 70147]EXF89483.1 hypothetical protein D554_0683 [Bordetella holmesii 30539]EXX95691.1 hypothetical protein D559_3129 [Bordetella holmesii 1058]KAK83312.1 hypoth
MSPGRESERQGTCKQLQAKVHVVSVEFGIWTSHTKSSWGGGWSNCEKTSSCATRYRIVGRSACKVLWS